MRRRVWSEFLPPEELGAEATVRLLARFDLEPIVALPPAAETSGMARALARLSRAAVPVGLWPLLEDGDGYWPSEENASAFVQRVRACLRFADAAGASVRTIAIDLEPPLSVTRRLLNGSNRERGALLLAGVQELDERRALRARSIEVLTDLSQHLTEGGYETIAAAVPPVVLDLFAGGELWQGVFRTPVTAPGWDVISPMMYTTAIRPLIPSRSMRSARALLYEAARMMVRGIGPRRSGMSIGLVQSGKLGDEPAFSSPDELCLDVGAARAAGIEDLALFCLEGVLHRGPPERWLEPYTRAPPLAPGRMLTVPLGALMRGASVGSALGRALLR